MSTRSILVVGAGFAGAVHARTLAEAGYDVTVIDQRDHIAGNAYDYRDANGVRVHRYGPHLFHTNNEAVVQWVRRFGQWVPYEHRVRALLPSGALAPLPVNRLTIEMVFGCRLASPEEAQALLDRVALPVAEVRNAADHLYATIGRELTELFFRPYTEKMWAMRLEDIDASVVKRIPLRLDDEDRYFPNDRFQIMPRDGYTALFESILDHPRIAVLLGTRFEHAMLAGRVASFLSVPIDEFFDFRFGELPYRSIRFDHRAAPRDPGLGWAVTNFTHSEPHTRETHWHVIPEHDGPGEMVTITRETPCDYKDNEHERYYPVRTADNRHQVLYGRYKEEAAKLPDIHFIGRCGTYQYLDMHQVINQSLMSAARWLSERGEVATLPEAMLTR